MKQKLLERLLQLYEILDQTKQQVETLRASVGNIEGAIADCKYWLEEISKLESTS